MCIIQNPSGLFCLLFLVSSSISLCGHAVYGEDEKADSIHVLNLNTVKDQAEIVLVGKLKLIAPPPYHVLNKDFYKISAIEVLKGRLPAKNFLVVYPLVNSYREGSEPNIEAHITYMLFLREVKITDVAAPKDAAYYQLVGNWKGIVSLDKAALEIRAVRNLSDNYRINVHDKSEEFKSAMRHGLREKESEEKQSEVNISPGARAVYEALKLRESQNKMHDN